MPHGETFARPDYAVKLRVVIIAFHGLASGLSVTF